MNSRIVWFVKNTKIYKRFKSLVLQLNNSYQLKVPPSLLFLSQHSDGVFKRYDVIVRYMAIEDLHEAGNSGMDLYHKMQVARNEFLTAAKTRIKTEDLHTEKSGTLEGLVASFKEKGFDHNHPLAVNPRLKLVDGSHRLACAMYFEQESLTVMKSESIEVDYGLEWFEQYFEPAEVTAIQTKYREIIKKVDVKAVLKDILYRERQTFGRGEFYQSCEEIDLAGQRPTTERYGIYGLDHHLNSDQQVLDIGCNCGFFTLLIAKKVRSAVGVEISESLVEIAQVTQAFLGRTNVHFRQGNFNKIKFDRKFDFIFSFAVHHWLGADMKKYGRRLSSMLNPGGKVLLESQNIHQQDIDWEQKVAQFKQGGFTEITNGKLKDDGVIERRFSLFKRN